MSSFYQKTYFLLSVAEVSQLPPDEGIEIAIVGRSNAGKSSVINCLTHQKNLSRVSKTPGRTQTINFFVIDDKRRLVDLPGYGYANAPPSIQQKWKTLVTTYIKTRQSLKGLILVMDIRHPLKALDLRLLDFAKEVALPVHILLNKSDKLSKSEAGKVIREVRGLLTKYPISVTLQSYSALKGTGVKELDKLLDAWYSYKKEE